ncbi:MAG: DUF4340 domain-containing protein [bacterium]
MKIKKEYIILAAVILFLSAYLLMKQKGKVHYSLLELKKADKKDITKIILKKAGLEIKLVKKNDKWIIEPGNFRANNDLVEKMADEISSLAVTDLVSESKNDVLYDLDKEKKIEVWACKGDEILRKIEIGKPASSYRLTFVKVENDGKIYHAKGNLANTFDKTLSGLRDKTVLSFKSEEITGVSITKANKKLSIVKSPAQASIDLNKDKTGDKKDLRPEWATDKGEAVNEAEIEEIVKTLSNLTCDDFIDDKKKSDIKNPSYSISLTGAKEYSISLFEKTGDKYTAISSESEYPFYISEWNAKRFMKDLDLLTEKKK